MVDISHIHTNQDFRAHGGQGAKKVSLELPKTEKRSIHSVPGFLRRLNKTSLR